MSSKKALLIVGSPRGKASTSHVLGVYLLGKLKARGFVSEIQLATAALMTAEKTAALVDAFRESDLVILSFPLYVDHLPAPLIRILETVESDLSRRAETHRPALAAVVQSGFPETLQNRPAVEVARLFAVQTGMKWLGGLAFGMGGAVNGKSLEKAGGMVRHVVKAFDLAVPALAEGRPIPVESVRLLEKPMMPTFFYGFMANFGFRKTARKKGCRENLRCRPYQETGWNRPK